MKPVSFEASFVIQHVLPSTITYQVEYLFDILFRIRSKTVWIFVSREAKVRQIDLILFRDQFIGFWRKL
jgi:hypothetical protein